MTSPVSSRDEAVAALRAALGRWRTDARGVARQATAVATGFHSEATTAVRQRKTKLSGLQAALMALGPDHDPAPLLRQVAAAEAALARATDAKAIADEVETEARALERRIVEATEGRAVAAEHDLARRLSSLSEYRAIASSSSANLGANGTAATSGPGAKASTEEQALHDKGLVSVPLSSTSHTDNPVIDGYHKGGASRADYRWAVETWQIVVRPGIARGATRDDFERRDAARGATDFHRTAGVYDMFLGDERLVFSRGLEGSLDVTNGRHRIDIARELGITHLPGEIK